MVAEPIDSFRNGTLIMYENDNSTNALGTLIQSSSTGVHGAP